VFGQRISDALFPAEIDKFVYEYLGIDYTIAEKYILLIATFGAFKMLIHQYNEIAALNTGTHCLYIDGIKNYAQYFADGMGRHAEKLAEQIRILNAFSGTNDETIIEYTATISQCIEKLNGALESVKKFERIEEMESLLEKASIAIMLLQAYATKGIQINID
jgi:hypothetical protein